LATKHGGDADISLAVQLRGDCVNVEIQSNEMIRVSMRRCAMEANNKGDLVVIAPFKSSMATEHGAT
jgi:hypothetical protein